MYIKKYTGSGDINAVIISGVHGNEYTPILAVRMLEESILLVNSTAFANLVVIGAANIDGIRHCMREIPSSGTSDLNRMFGSESDCDIVSTIKKHVSQCDLVIDVHSSPNCTEFILINQDVRANGYVDYANEIGINYAVNYSDTNTVKKFGLGIGIMSFTLELNGMDRIDTASACEGSRIIWDIIKNIEKFKDTSEQPRYESVTEFKHYKEGLFVSKVKAGDEVTDGMVVGTIIDLDTLEECELTYSGKHARIICAESDSYVMSRKTIFLLQPLV